MDTISNIKTTDSSFLVESSHSIWITTTAAILQCLSGAWIKVASTTEPASTNMILPKAIFIAFPLGINQLRTYYMPLKQVANFLNRGFASGKLGGPVNRSRAPLEKCSPGAGIKCHLPVFSRLSHFRASNRAPYLNTQQRVLLDRDRAAGNSELPERWLTLHSKPYR